MDKAQADAAAKAILEPLLHAQETARTEREARHAAEHALLVRKRRIAWFVLAGAGIGTAIAYFAGVRFIQGIVWGGLVGTAVGWLITRRAT